MQLGNTESLSETEKTIIELLLVTPTMTSAEISTVVGVSATLVQNVRDEYFDAVSNNAASVPWVDSASSPPSVGDDDITERGITEETPNAASNPTDESSHESQQQVTYTDELVSLVQKIGGIGAWEFERKTNTLQWSEQAYNIHGIKPGSTEILDAAIKHYHLSDREKITRALDDIITDEEEHEIEVRFVRQDGEIRWAQIHGVPWYKNGELWGAHGTIQDITDEKERKTELQFFREAVEQAGHGVVITNRQGEIEYVNPTYEQDTGYELDEILGKNPRISKSGKHDEEFYEEMWETILAGDVWETEELINRRKSGELYHVDQTIAPITTEDGEITHFIGIESEITDLRLREQRLDVLNRLLRHNLRNSITVIQGHLSTIESTGGNPELQWHVETINDRIEHLTSISDKVATLQSLFDDEFVTDETYEITGIVDTLIERFSSQYPNTSITTTTPADDVTVRCDDRVEIALKEAIENAITHNDKECPAVEVSVSRSNDSVSWVTVEVIDNGPGIPNQDRKAIETGEETAVTHATSIGLWIIYWVVKFFGGDVEITDNKSEGSTVEMTLPAASNTQDTA